MPERRVLVVSYGYPPLTGPGTFRIVKITKYLREFGWSPVVLTVKNPDPFLDSVDPFFFDTSDCRDIEIVRTYCFNLGLIFGSIEKLWRSIRALMVPDIYVGWVPHSIKTGIDLINKEKIDVIFSSYFPSTNILIGFILKKITNKPLIIDYQDVLGRIYPTRLHAWIDLKLHEKILSEADYVTVVNNAEKNILLKLFPCVDSNKVEILELCYDPSDFKRVKPKNFDRFTFLHTGGIFRDYFRKATGKLALRDVYDRVTPFKVFAEAIYELIFENDVKSNEFQAVLIGWVDPSVLLTIRDLGLDDVIRYEGAKSHHEAVRYMLGADVLLLFPGIKSATPLKLFEYMASGGFILNIGDLDGEASKLIKEAGCGITVPPLKGRMKEILLKIIKQKPTRNKVKCRKSFVSNFSAREIAKKLVKLLNKSVAN